MNSGWGLCKKPWSDTLICRFPKGIWLPTQREVGANTTSLWSSERNRHSHKDALQKHKTKSLLTRWRHILLWHCCRCSFAPYLLLICLDYVLRTSIDLMKENDLTLKKARSRWYPAQTITDADYVDDSAAGNYTHPGRIPLHSLEKAVSGIGLHVNADKTKYVCFNQNQTRDISTLTGSSLKLVDKFVYLGSIVSPTKNNINTRLAKAWSVIDRLSVLWKSDLSNKIKRNFS